MPVIATTTPAPARSLTTQRRYTDLTGPLPAGITAARFTAMIGQATSLIEDHCGRVFARERVTEAIHEQRGHPMLLERTPVVAIQGVTIDGDSVEPGAFRIIDPDAGIVCVGGSGDSSTWAWSVLNEGELGSRCNRPPPMLRYEVDYTGGWVPAGWPVTDPPTVVTLPQALESACIEVVRNLLLGGGASAGLQSEKLGDTAWVYRDDAGSALAGQVPALLQRYRRVTPPSFA